MLTPDGKLAARNADISGHINANSGTLNNVTIEENCTIKGTMQAENIIGDLAKSVAKAFPGSASFPNGTITVRILDDHHFDRQITILPIIFAGAMGESSTSNQVWTSCALVVAHNGREIYNNSTIETAKAFSTVLDMPAGGGSVTLSFSISTSRHGNSPAASVSSLVVIVTKKSTAGISIT